MQIEVGFVRAISVAHRARLETRGFSVPRLNRSGISDRASVQRTTDNGQLTTDNRQRTNNIPPSYIIAHVYDLVALFPGFLEAAIGTLVGIIKSRASGSTGNRVPMKTGLGVIGHCTRVMARADRGSRDPCSMASRVMSVRGRGSVRAGIGTRLARRLALPA